MKSKYELVRPTPACVCKPDDGTRQCPYEEQCFQEWLDVMRETT